MFLIIFLSKHFGQNRKVIASWEINSTIEKDNLNVYKLWFWLPRLNKLHFVKDLKFKSLGRHSISFCYIYIYICRLNQHHYVIPACRWRSLLPVWARLTGPLVPSLTQADYFCCVCVCKVTFKHLPLNSYPKFCNPRTSVENTPRCRNQK